MLIFHQSNLEVLHHALVIGIKLIRIEALTMSTNLKPSLGMNTLEQSLQTLDSRCVFKNSVLVINT